ncbi:hypothetical protein O9X80_18205 [Agrobacterium salinitolerans]|uniref:hypothetical protein n=1 Tax=Agrobacterium salinitolerans TaxID=1183413 RepID=UPI0022B83CAC|nr:hypothetical protein [Agrobacterium salinitolerans]MCZ7976434.1 hypothetical protein [Agrobacterium salinitolerans]
MTERLLQSPFEIVCLQWIAHGKSIDDIALLEGVTRELVEVRLDRAILSLNAKSVGEALEILSLTRHE